MRAGIKPRSQHGRREPEAGGGANLDGGLNPLRERTPQKPVIASEAKQSMSCKALLMLDCRTRFAGSQ